MVLVKINIHLDQIWNYRQVQMHTDDNAWLSAWFHIWLYYILLSQYFPDKVLQFELENGVQLSPINSITKSKQTKLIGYYKLHDRESTNSFCLWTKRHGYNYNEITERSVTDFDSLEIWIVLRVITDVQTTKNFYSRLDMQIMA